MTSRVFGWIGVALALLLAGSGWLAPAAHANNLCVNPGGTGGCFPTITAAVSVAAAGDTILVAGGSPYFERLTIDKSLNLIGEGAASTIIDGAEIGQVIRITFAVTVTLTGLTIRHGQSGPGYLADQSGGGIHNELARLTLNNVVVSNNQTGGGAGCCGGNGGGISNDQGNLTLNHTIVSGNITGTPLGDNSPNSSGGSGGDGGGIYNFRGRVTLNDSTVSGNVTGAGAFGNFSGGHGGFGGGIATNQGTLILNRTTIRANVTGNGSNGGTHDGNGGAGGGIYDFLASPLTLNDSTISDNQTGTGATGGGTNGASGSGAGLYIDGSPAFNRVITIGNSTISGNLTGHGQFGNDGGDGGGIFDSRTNTVSLINVTLAYNSVDADQIGGAIANNGGTVYVKNSLLAHNHNAFGVDNITDCSGTVISLGNNVMMEPDCTMLPGATGTPTDQFYVRGTLLAPLADNGGPTFTHALTLGSIAIDAADNVACSPTDQRGFPRPVFGGMALACDVGAFELYRFGVRLALVVR